MPYMKCKIHYVYAVSLVITTLSQSLNPLAYLYYVPVLSWIFYLCCSCVEHYDPYLLLGCYNTQSARNVLAFLSKVLLPF
jgi:hypothetical protein